MKFNIKECLASMFEQKHRVRVAVNEYELKGEIVEVGDDYFTISTANGVPYFIPFTAINWIREIGK